MNTVPVGERPFTMPRPEVIDEDAGILVPKDWHDATITNWIIAQTKKGMPMINVVMTLDNGTFQGSEFTEYCVMGMQSGMGEAKLKKILLAAGRTESDLWEDKPTFGAFVRQFPVGTMRVGVLVDHEHQINTGPKQWETVSEAEFNDYSGKKMISAKPADYRGPTDPAVAKFDAPAEPASMDTANLPF